jgi:hypothetical protein
MPKLNVDINSKYAAKETYDKIKNLFGDSSDIKKFDPDIKSEFDDSALSCKAKGSKFSADLKVAPTGDSSQVSIEVDLPFLLGAFKGQIKSTIEKKLNTLLS